MKLLITETLLIAIGTYIFTLVLIWGYRRRQSQRIFQKYGIPGPNPSFLTGNLLQLREAPSLTTIISKWLKEYGNIFGYFIGETPHLVINDISILKQILIRDFHNFTNRDPMSVLIYPFMDSVLGLTDSRWKEVRDILTPTFSASKIKTMFKIVNDKVSTTIEVVTAKAVADKEFNIHILGEGLALDVIADAALAMKVNCQKNPNDPFLVTTKIFFESASNKIVNFVKMFSVFRALLRFVVPYTIAGKMTNMLVKNLKYVIQYRRDHPEIRGIDLLQLMLDSSELNDSEIASNDQRKTVRITDAEIVGNACVALLAGYETTANSFAFAFYLLVQHPEVQEKLYDEILEICPHNDQLTYDKVNSMPYLDQVINESLRIYPPVVNFVKRLCQSDYNIGKYIIPKGMIVFVPIWDIHHDPDLWPDPWAFKPERFSPENKGKIDKISYLPFGRGPRNCIGMRLALLELKLAVARLIRNFEFLPSEKTENPIILHCPTVIITPKNGVFLKAKLRE